MMFKTGDWRLADTKYTIPSFVILDILSAVDSGIIVDFE